MICFFTLTVATSHAASPALPDSIQEQILILQASGKIAQADSLTKVWTAKVQLEATKATAQKKLEKGWAEEVDPKSAEDSVAWINSKAKAFWLSRRWVDSGLISAPVDTMGDLGAGKLTLLGEVKKTASFKSAVAKEVSRQLGDFSKMVTAIGDRRYINMDGATHKALKSKIQTASEAVKGLGQRVGQAEAGINTLAGRIGTAEVRIDSTEVKITSIEARLSATELNALAALKSIDFCKIKAKARKDAEEFRQKRLAEAKAELNPPPPDKEE